MVFRIPERIFQKVDFEKNQQTEKSTKYGRQKVKMIHQPIVVSLSGYICREVAKICVRQDNYKHATILNTIVLKQIRICGHQEVAKFVESLLDCHLSTGQREKAVEVILESSLLEGNITSCVALWVKLKREAIAKQQTDFLQR